MGACVLQSCSYQNDQLPHLDNEAEILNNKSQVQQKDMDETTSQIVNENQNNTSIHNKNNNFSTLCPTSNQSRQQQQHQQYTFDDQTSNNSYTYQNQQINNTDGQAQKIINTQLFSQRDSPFNCQQQMLCSANVNIKEVINKNQKINLDIAPITEEISNNSSAIQKSSKTSTERLISDPSNQSLKQKVIFSSNIVKYSDERKKYPPIKLTNGYIYEGEWLFGKQDGFGITEFPDFQKYEGNYSNGKANGHGILTFPDGDFYIGQFSNDKQQGMGRYIQKGSEYVGEWNEGKQHGRGYELWGIDMENSYEGSYEQGFRHGKGKLEIGERFKYVGDFIKNNMNGYGIIKFHDGRVYEGQFQNNQMNGKGRMKIKDTNEMYIGNFKNDLFEGVGTFIYSNKSKYIGEWHTNKMHGQGLLINNKGERFKGVWVNGKCKTKLQSVMAQSSSTNTSKRKKLSDISYNNKINEQNIDQFQFQFDNCNIQKIDLQSEVNNYNISTNNNLLSLKNIENIDLL